MKLPDGSESHSFEEYSQAKYVYTGITRIRFSSANRPGFCVLKINRNGTVANPSIPSNVAVIPSDANGPFEVILESSVDMIPWNVANPRTFGGDTPRRFFRTRIARKKLGRGDPVFAQDHREAAASREKNPKPFCFLISEMLEYSGTIESAAREASEAHRFMQRRNNAREPILAHPGRGARIFLP